MNLLQRIEVASLHAIMERMAPGKGQLIEDAFTKGQAAGLTPAAILAELFTILWSNAGPQIISALEAWIASLLPKP